MNIKKYMKRVDIIKLLKDLGIQDIKDMGDNVMGLCPFHVEKNSSWGISKNTGLWNCFSCGEKGNIITLVARVKEVGIKQAIFWLYKIIGVRRDFIPIGTKMIYRQIKKIIKGGVDNIIQKEEKNVIVCLPKYVNNNFIPGLLYFKGRGINKVTLRKHNITFCTDGFYRNRAIVPIVNDCGKLISFESRDLTGMAEKKVLYPKNTKVNHTLYNLKEAKQNSEVVITEGLMDVLYLDQRGFNTVATFGINISEKQEELLSRYFKKIYIAFDGDKAGHQGMIKYGSYLSLHQSVYIITLDKNKDPDNYTKEEFNKLKNNAVEIQSYISKKILNQIKLNE